MICTIIIRQHEYIKKSNLFQMCVGVACIVDTVGKTEYVGYVVIECDR